MSALFFVKNAVQDLYVAIQEINFVDKEKSINKEMPPRTDGTSPQNKIDNNVINYCIYVSIRINSLKQNYWNYPNKIIKRMYEKKHSYEIKFLIFEDLPYGLVRILTGIHDVIR